MNKPERKIAKHIQCMKIKISTLKHRHKNGSKSKPYYFLKQIEVARKKLKEPYKLMRLNKK